MIGETFPEALVLLLDRPRRMRSSRKPCWRLPSHPWTNFAVEAKNKPKTDAHGLGL